MHDPSSPSADFEHARHCILDLMALSTHEFALSTTPDARRVELFEERNRLGEELRNLHPDDHAEIARICREYGERLQRWSREHKNRSRAP